MMSPRKLHTLKQFTDLGVKWASLAENIRFVGVVTWNGFTCSWWGGLSDFESSFGSNWIFPPASEVTWFLVAFDSNPRVISLVVVSPRLGLKSMNVYWVSLLSHFLLLKPSDSSVIVAYGSELRDLVWSDEMTVSLQPCAKSSIQRWLGLNHISCVQSYNTNSTSLAWSHKARAVWRIASARGLLFNTLKHRKWR
jgi:hypothetical protein